MYGQIICHLKNLRILNIYYTANCTFTLFVPKLIIKKHNFVDTNSYWPFSTIIFTFNRNGFTFKIFYILRSKLFHLET